MNEEVKIIIEDIKNNPSKTTFAFFADEDKLVNEVVNAIKDKYKTEIEYEDGEILLTVEKKENTVK